MSIDLTPSLEAKSFYRFTGPPENWLTAIKYMTWGLERKYLDRWKNIQTGDVFFIHSTGTSSLSKNAKSGIIGIGVVGSKFSIKENPLWIHEVESEENKWPLLVPFSEIYLFSELPDVKTWDAPNNQNILQTERLISALLQNYIPLSSIKGFPQMGSFSSVNKEAADQILFDKRPLYVYADQAQSEDSIMSSKPTEFQEIKSSSEALRYADTLKVFNNIQTRIIKDAPGHYMKNNELLARAEVVHSTILQNLIDMFRKRGYETMSNKYVDLYAHNESKSFLFEVKSTENSNFRSQARKGLIQLFEYDYFEVSRFVKEKQLNLKEQFKILVPSQEPVDNNYVGFINNLKVGIALAGNDTLKPVGKDSGFSKF